MKRKFPIVPAVIAAIVVLALAALLISTVGGDDGETGEGVEETRPVALEGSGLPVFDTAASPDPAVGRAAPRLEGLSFDGTPVAITPDGRPKLVVFLAHWCPHCQAEVPVIRQWLEDGGQPEGVDLYAVSTGVSRDRPNFPPSEWLADEGWTIPTLADDDESSGAAAYGLSSYPYFVAIGADGDVVARGSGELSPADLDQLVAAISD